MYRKLQKYIVKWKLLSKWPYIVKCKKLVLRKKKTNLLSDFLLTSSRLTYKMRSEFALSRPSLWTGTAGLVRNRLGFSDSEYLNSGLHFSKIWMMSVVNLATNCMNKQLQFRVNHHKYVDKRWIYYIQERYCIKPTLFSW